MEADNEEMLDEDEDVLDSDEENAYKEVVTKRALLKMEHKIK